MELTPGAIIGGRYRAERRLGAGGVGQVWAGESLADGSRVAIKTLLPAVVGHHELVTRFKREANFLARIRSQNVARVLDFLSDESYGFALVLELVDGQPLNELLRRGPLSVEEAIDIGWDVLGGIADLHREHIIHRDLKPGNVIVQTLPSGKRRAVVVDFGMSRFTGLDLDGEELTQLTRADIAVGTMEYMAPEQVLDSRSVTTAADIYAVGAMLYRAVAGRHIFGADLKKQDLARHKLVNDPPPLSTGRADALARGFEALVNRMIQRAAADRYSRAEEVLAQLAALRSGAIPSELTSSPVHAPPRAPELSYSSSPEASAAPIYASLPDLVPARKSNVGVVATLTFVLLLGAALAGIVVMRPDWLRLASSVAPPESARTPLEAPPATRAAPTTVLEPLASSTSEAADAPAAVPARPAPTPVVVTPRPANPPAAASKTTQPLPKSTALPKEAPPKQISPKESAPTPIDNSGL